MWCRQTEKKKETLKEIMRETNDELDIGLVNVEEALYWTDNMNARIREARKGSTIRQ